MHVDIHVSQSMLSGNISLLQRQHIFVFSKTSRPAVGAYQFSRSTATAVLCLW